MAPQNTRIKLESDYLTQGAVSVVYEAQLTALRETLDRFRVPKRDYSLLEAQTDDSVCLACREGKWITYTYEKGSESNPMTFMSFDDAADNVMDCLSDSEVETNQMKLCYKDILSRAKMTQPAPTSIYEEILK